MASFDDIDGRDDTRSGEERLPSDAKCAPFLFVRHRSLIGCTKVIQRRRIQSGTWRRFNDACDQFECFPFQSADDENIFVQRNVFEQASSGWNSINTTRFDPAGITVPENVHLLDAG